MPKIVQKQEEIINNYFLTTEDGKCHKVSKREYDKKEIGPSIGQGKPSE